MNDTSHHVDDTELGIIIAVSVIVAVLVILFLVWLCCYQHGKFVSPCEKRRHSDNRRLIEDSQTKRISTKKDLLVKRCNQSSTNEIENLIIARLKRNLPAKIVEGAWDQASDDGQRPVIVFCVISSRIGTDIENAIRGVHGNSPVVLVLLHCVLSSLLRGDLSDDEELLDTTLRNRMTGIAHFAFSDREGLYDCHQNRVGFNKLNEIVSSLMK